MTPKLVTVLPWFLFLKNIYQKIPEVVILLTISSFGELSYFVIDLKSQMWCDFSVVLKYFAAVFPLVN